jgi:hypothetical protein
MRLSCLCGCLLFSVVTLAHQQSSVKPSQSGGQESTGNTSVPSEVDAMVTYINRDQSL